MHHRLARVQLGEVTNQYIRIDGAAIVLTPPADALAEQIAFANQRALALGVDKTALAGANHQAVRLLIGLLEAIDRLRAQFDAGQQLLQALAATFAFY